MRISIFSMHKSATKFSSALKFLQIFSHYYYMIFPPISSCYSLLHSGLGPLWMLSNSPFMWCMRPNYTYFAQITSKILFLVINYVLLAKANFIVRKNLEWVQKWPINYTTILPYDQNADLLENCTIVWLNSSFRLAVLDLLTLTNWFFVILYKVF